MRESQPDAFNRKDRKERRERRHSLRSLRSLRLNQLVQFMRELRVGAASRHPGWATAAARSTATATYAFVLDRRQPFVEAIHVGGKPDRG